jgi:hypothetical protein
MNSSSGMSSFQNDSNTIKDPNKLEIDMHAMNVDSDYDKKCTQKGSNHQLIQLSSKLQKQTCRWLNLSKTLLALLVTNISNDNLQEEGGLTSFFDAIEWKMDGSINDEEFTMLYNEWINHSNTIVDSTKNSRILTDSTSLSNIQFVRQLLIDRNCSESKMDIYIASILQQNNLILIDFPVSYIMRDHIIKNPSNLELCTEKWLFLCEELFFALDILGYGSLKYDDIYFFCGCLVLGCGKKSDVDHNLELIQLTGMAIQFIKDATNSMYDFVPLSMFKRYFVIYLQCFLWYFIALMNIMTHLFQFKQRESTDHTYLRTYKISIIILKSNVFI